MIWWEIHHEKGWACLDQEVQVDSEAEEPVEPARGERVVDKEEEEERWRAMSLSMSVNPVNPVDLLLLLSPEEKPPA